jgi:hypothetical protein
MGREQSQRSQPESQHEQDAQAAAAGRGRAERSRKDCHRRSRTLFAVAVKQVRPSVLQKQGMKQICPHASLPTAGQSFLSICELSNKPNFHY